MSEELTQQYKDVIINWLKEQVKNNETEIKLVDLDQYNIEQLQCVYELEQEGYIIKLNESEFVIDPNFENQIKQGVFYE